MSDDTRYNGWTNYETWNCALWIGNDQGSQEYMAEQAREILERHDWDKDEARSDVADMIESWVSEQEDEQQVSGMFADLLRAAIGAIDWRELADHYLADIEVYSAGWNLPGYMPDNPPSLFGDADDAREFIADSIESVADETEQEGAPGYDSLIAHMREAAEACRDGRGEYGSTVGAFHYFVTQV